MVLEKLMLNLGTRRDKRSQKFDFSITNKKGLERFKQYKEWLNKIRDELWDPLLQSLWIIKIVNNITTETFMQNK